MELFYSAIYLQANFVHSEPPPVGRKQRNQRKKQVHMWFPHATNSTNFKHTHKHKNAPPARESAWHSNARGALIHRYVCIKQHHIIGMTLCAAHPLPPAGQVSGGPHTLSQLFQEGLAVQRHKLLARQHPQRVHVARVGPEGVGGQPPSPAGGRSPCRAVPLDLSGGE